jgi:hypothetical protein
MSNRKLNLTSTLIQELDLPIDLHQALTTWYKNIRTNGGYRLTDVGYITLNNGEIESWSIDIADIKKIINKKTLLDLDRKIQYPYYLDFKNKKLILFSSKEAVMVSLYGDLQNWLNNLQSR